MVRRHDTLDGWLVTDAATALTVLRDPATWSSDHFGGPRPAEHAAWAAELAAEDDGVRELLQLTPQALIGLDPPDHTRLRSVLRRRFAPAVIERYRPLVQAEADALLDGIVTGEPVEVVETFTRPLPFRIVARLLEIPEPDWPVVEALAHAASTDDTANETREQFRARLTAERDVMRYFVDAGTLRDPTITAREAAGLCREVLVAGSDSVGHLLAGALTELDAHRDDIPALIEHRLRTDPPFTGFWRRATGSTRLDGTEIPAGGLVQLDYGAINAGAARHLSFGHGVHFCLGAALARLEATVVLDAIAAATDRVEPAGPAERLASPAVGGYRRLTLRFVPRGGA